jgi:hypothetical protein
MHLDSIDVQNLNELICNKKANKRKEKIKKVLNIE